MEAASVVPVHVLAQGAGCEDPKSVGKAQRIDLRAKDLTTMNGVSEARGMRVLNIGNNQLSRIEDLLRAPNLVDLRVYHNKLRSMEGIERCVALQELQLQHNDLRRIEAVSRLRRLVALRLDGNKLTNKTGDLALLASCTHLASLDLAGNQLVSLRGIERLARLQELRIADNEAISDLKPILRCVTLTELDVSGIRSITLSQVISLAPLRRLQSLRLNRMQQGVAVAFLLASGTMQALLDLSMCTNQLTTLPEVGHTIPNLEQVDLAFNAIANPEGLLGLASCGKLVEVSIHGNPVVQPAGKHVSSVVSVLPTTLQQLDGVNVTARVSSSAQGIRPLAQHTYRVAEATESLAQHRQAFRMTVELMRERMHAYERRFDAKADDVSDEDNNNDGDKDEDWGIVDHEVEAEEAIVDDVLVNSRLPVSAGDGVFVTQDEQSDASEGHDDKENGAAVSPSSPGLADDGSADAAPIAASPGLDADTNAADDTDAADTNATDDTDAAPDTNAAADTTIAPAAHDNVAGAPADKGQDDGSHGNDPSTAGGDEFASCSPTAHGTQLAQAAFERAKHLLSEEMLAKIEDEFRSIEAQVQAEVEKELMASAHVKPNATSGDPDGKQRDAAVDSAGADSDAAFATKPRTKTRAASAATGGRLRRPKSAAARGIGQTRRGTGTVSAVPRPIPARRKARAG